MFLSLDFTARPVSETHGIDFPKYKVVATVIIHSTVYTSTGSYSLLPDPFCIP